MHGLVARGVIRRATATAVACLLLIAGAALATPYTIGDPEQRAAAARNIVEWLAQSRARHGADSPAYADAIATSLETLLAAGRPEEAAAFAREAMGIYRATEARGGGLHMHAMDGLVDALLALGRTGEAVEVLKEKLEIARGREGRPGSFDDRTVTRLYFLLERMGRYREAEKLRREELAAVRSHGSEAFWSSPRAMKFFMRQVEPRLLSELATLMARQGRHNEARRLHVEALSKARLIFADGIGPTWKLVQAYGRFLETHGVGAEDAAALAHLKAVFPRAFPP